MKASLARNRRREYWAEKPQRFARIIEMFLNRGDHLYLWHFQLVRPINFPFYLSQFELNTLYVVTVVVAAV